MNSQPRNRPDVARLPGRVWLGIDIGTKGVRAVLADGTGAVVGIGRADILGTRGSGARHEQDPVAWWHACRVAAVQAMAGADARPVGAVAVDSTSGTVLLQRGDLSPVGAALMYDDSRAVAQETRIHDVLADLPAAVRGRVQHVAALARVLWLRDSGGLEAGARLAHQGDYVGSRLVGHRVATDSSSALKAGYDLVDRRWPGELLAALDLDESILPEVVEPGSRLGVVGREAAGQCGIPAGTPLVAGMTDGCAAQLAVAAVRPGSWSSSLGTTLVVKGVSSSRLQDRALGVYSHRSPDGDWWPGGASSTGAGSLAADFPGWDVTTIAGEAARLPDPVAGVTYPLVGHGERFPFVDPLARGFRSGVPDDDLSRCAGTLQGVAYLERLCFEVLAGLGADTSGPLTLSGGATRNRPWNQLRVDVLGRDAQLPRTVDAAFGMAVLAAAPHGGLADTAEGMVELDEQLEPDQVRGERFEASYQQFREALVQRGWLDAARLTVRS